MNIPADYIIDATGLEADITEHRLLKDLFDMTGAQRNPYGKMQVELSFEVTGTRNGDGLIFASGSATLGGPYATVDSFLGLQYQALRITDELQSTASARSSVSAVRRPSGGSGYATSLCRKKRAFEAPARAQPRAGLLLSALPRLWAGPGARGASDGRQAGGRGLLRGHDDRARR